MGQRVGGGIKRGGEKGKKKGGGGGGGRGGGGGEKAREGGESALGGRVTKTKPEFKNKVYHRRKTTGLEKVGG